MLYRLAHNVELVEREGGMFLVSKTPLCVLRLNRSLADLVARGAGGAPIDPSEAEVAVMEQLAAKGFAERLRSAPQQPVALPDISIIIPVKDRAGELQRCLASLSSLDYPQEKLQVIVVDDGSSDESALVARQFGALVVPSGGTGRGPAAARNVGASMADRRDPRLHRFRLYCFQGVAQPNCPRLQRSGHGSGGRAGGRHVYRIGCRSLRGGHVQPLARCPRAHREQRQRYLLPAELQPPGPAQCVQERRRFQGQHARGGGRGPDLAPAGPGLDHILPPAGNVLHEHRSSIRSFMSRRFDYGTSEGMLQLLHPRRHKRMVIPASARRMSCPELAAPFAGWWPLLRRPRHCLVSMRSRSGCVCVAAGSPSACRRSSPGGCGRWAAWPTTSAIIWCATMPSRCVFLAFFSPQLWILVGRCVLVRRRGRLCDQEAAAVVASLRGIYLLEQVAYGAGVFWGCLRGRIFASYRVVMLRHMKPSEGAGLYPSRLP